MNEPVVSTPQAGSDDGVLALMKRFNLPMTREQYIELAYMGEVPEQIGAEEEAGLPEQFQLK
jgi:hypothetical protein